MADKRTLVSTVQLKGPAGSVSTDKRVLVSTVNLHGPKDVRTRVNQVTLVAPPPDKRVRVSQVQLVGSASPQRPVYYGTSDGWMPVDLYLAVNGAWTKVT